MQLFKASSLYLVIMLMALGVQAQQPAPILSLKQAVEIALKNNFNIRLAQNNVSISSNNVTLGNAGMLPQVTGSISQANSAQNITQTKSDGSVANLNGVQNSTFNYGLNLNWTVFNGLAMFASYNQLKQLNQYNQIASRDTVEATIAAVLANYYSLVYQKQQIGAQVGAIVISQTQLKFARDKFMAGRASQLDVLNAQVNLNTDTAAYITLLQNFDQSKTKLNQLLARGASTNFTVTDTITIDESLRLADVLNQAQTRNPAILLAQINQNVAQLSLQQVKAARYPVVGLNAGYAYTDAKTPAGFTHEQVSNGLSYGLTASVNIFNGLEQWRKERNAKLQIANAGLLADKAKQSVEAQVTNYYIAYYSGLSQVKLGKANVDVAKHNLDISLEKYKLGNITPLEVREAELNYLDAQSRFLGAQYQVKSAEIVLKQLTSNINM